MILSDDFIKLYTYGRWGGDIRVTSFNLTGKIVKEEFYSPNLASRFHDILIDGDNLIAVFNDYNNHIGKIAVFSENDTAIYELLYEGFSVEPTGIVKLENNHYIVSGYLYRNNEPTSINEGIIFELDEKFSIINKKLIGGSGIDLITDITLINNAYFVAIGFTSSIDGDFKYNSIRSLSIIIRSSIDFINNL